MSSVYWIHHPEHTDMFSQGYIGVSKDIKKRFEAHKNRPLNAHLGNAIKKYGWDNLIKKVILVADEAYCLMIESQLRPNAQIGWNAMHGGGMPPLTKWNLGKSLSNETKQKISSNRKGYIAWNKGKPMNEKSKIKLNKIIQGIHCGKEGNIGVINRWHMDNCKVKENKIG